MAYGIHVENTQGKVQIDQDYVNYVLVASSSFPLYFDSNTYGVATGSVSVSNYTAQDDDIICVNTGHEYNLVHCKPSGSGFVYEAWPNGSNATVQVKIFRKMSSITSSSTPALPTNRGYGLDVFTSSGAVAYSSYYEPMIVKAIIQGDPPFDASYAVSGYTPYISTNTAFVRSFNAPPDGSFYGETGFQMVSADSSNAYAHESVAEGGIAGSNYNYSGIVSALVIKG